LLFGALVIWRQRRMTAATPVAEAETSLSADERKKLDAILKDAS
jgi:hypothetical protein